MTTPIPTPTVEQLTDDEERVIYDSSASGRIEFFANPLQRKIEIVELMIFPIAANRIQIFRNNTAITPKWDLGPRQSMTDHGFILGVGGTIQIQVDLAVQVQALMIWRPKVLCPEV